MTLGLLPLRGENFAMVRPSLLSQGIRHNDGSPRERLIPILLSPKRLRRVSPEARLRRPNRQFDCSTG